MPQFVVEAAVEGELDEAVLRKAAVHLDMGIGNVYGRQGRPQLEASINGYNRAAERWPWIVLVDLDTTPCPAELRQSWLLEEAPFMCLRVAVQQVESWLLADTENMAALLGVRRALLPRDPDAEENAKRTVVQLAERSNRRKIREALVPAPGSRRQVGQLYNPVLGAFVRDKWDPTAAADRSESLSRSLAALNDLRDRWHRAAES